MELSPEASLLSIHKYQYFDISSYLEIVDFINFASLNKAFNELLLKNKEGLFNLKTLIWKELGILNDLENDKLYFGTDSSDTLFYNDIDNCKRIYSSVIRHWNPQIVRFVGYRTTGGVDQNNTAYSISNLFTFNSSKLSLNYSSDISPNVNVTGIAINENV